MLRVRLSDNYFSISFQDDSTKSSYRRSLSAGSFVSSGRIFQLFLITGFPVPLFLLRFLVLAVVDWDRSVRILNTRYPNMTIKIESIIAIASFIAFPSLINFKYREYFMYRTINNFSVVFLIYIVSRFQPDCGKVAVSVSVLPLRKYESAKDLNSGQPN